MDLSFAGNFWLYLPLVGLIVAIIVLIYAMVTISNYNKIPSIFLHSKKFADAMDLNAKKLTDLRNQVQVMQTKKDQIHEELIRLKQNYAEAVQQDKDLDQLRNNLEQLERQYTERLTDLKLKIETKERELSELKDKSAEYERIKRELNEYEEKRALIKQQQAELAELEQKIEDLRAEQSLLHVDKEIASNLQSILTEAFNKDNFSFDENSLADGFKQAMTDQGRSLAQSFDEVFKNQGNALAQSFDNVFKSHGQALGKALLNQAEVLDSSLKKDLDAQHKAVMHVLNEQLSNNIRDTAYLIQKYIQGCFDQNQLKKENQRLHDENDKLKLNKETDAFADLYRIPSCLSFTQKTNNRKPENELQALDNFYDYLKNNKLIFSQRLIKSFHTSLKIQDISPLTVLAGLSGTGKSLLPTQYAKYFGMNNLIISVQPRWDSPQDLLGFYNYLTGKYQATDLAKSLNAYDYVFRRKNKLNNKNIRYFDNNDVIKDLSDNSPMLLVLLDEMNLARTEYYFSEFLSKLEFRRNVKNITDEEISQAEISLNVQNDLKLWVPKNILFVGTMNEDETTQTLADKVLDRSDVIRFGRPNKVDNETQIASDNENKYFINYETWCKWIKKSFDNNQDKVNVNNWIVELSKLMKDLGRPFGLRVDNSIRDYIMNYPHDGVNIQTSLKYAMSDQIEHKILPKLRGVDVNSKRNELNALKEFVATKLSDAKLAESISQSIDISSQETGIFNWVGLYRADE